MPMETMAAPMCPITSATASEAGRGEARNHTGGQNVLHARIHQHVQDADGGHAGNQRNRNVAFGMLDLASDHVQVVPSVIRPQSGHQRGHESGNTALGSGKCSGKVAPAASGGAAGAAEADEHDAENDDDFQDGEYELNSPAFFYSQIIQDRDKNGCGDGDELPPGNGEGVYKKIFSEKKEKMENVPRMAKPVRLQWSPRRRVFAITNHVQP